MVELSVWCVAAGFLGGLWARFINTWVYKHILQGTHKRGLQNAHLHWKEIQGFVAISVGFTSRNLANMLILVLLKLPFLPKLKSLSG